MRNFSVGIRSVTFVLSRKSISSWLALALLVVLAANWTINSYAANPTTFQATNSNTSSQIGSWARFSEDTATHFTVNASGYTNQLNLITNGCSYGESGCAWWVQVTADYTTYSNSTSGCASSDIYCLAGLDIEQWYYNNSQALNEQVGTWNLCGSSSTSCNVGENYVGMVSFLQVTVFGSKMQLELVVKNENTSTTLVSYTQNVTLAYSVDSISGCGDCPTENVVEGVTTGDPALGSHNVVFSGATGTVIFGYDYDAYVDLWTSSNSLGCTTIGTQTGETSNLNESEATCVNESYNGGHLASPEFNQVICSSNPGEGPLFGVSSYPPANTTDVTSR
jgi:hypothetical protein